MATLQDRSPVWKSARPFVLGGLAACSATFCVQPIDMVKVRIQLQGEGTKGNIIRNPFTMAKHLISNEGFFSLYHGLSAALLRQLTYGTTRLGVFRTCTDYLTPPGKTAADIGGVERLIASLTAGGIGALVGTPADAALIRMQSDSTLPPNLRRNYKNAIDALFRMFKEEGLKGFFSGGTPTIIRGLAINVGMFVTYDPCYAYFKQEKIITNDQLNRFVSGAISGWTAATVSLPFDFIKTRIQKQKAGPDGKLPYNGFFDCFSKVAKTEGLGAFYKGYMTFVVRITPHIMLTWVFMDNFTILFKKWKI
jgi:solute carrier family 25 oxoglutarate transporter 11